MRLPSLVFVVLVAACGGAPAPIVSQPPVHETAHTPPAERAKWVFSTPEHDVHARLDLGNGKTLYVGEHGRREIESSGTPEYATALAEDDLTGILKEAKRYVFVAADGDTWASTEPLGALQRLSPARTEPLSSVTAGNAAIVGIDKTGALVRSVDGGITWKRIDYASPKPYGKASSVALDGKGNGVLVHVPQRLFVTHDDGATWTSIASPTHGAAFVFRDGADRIFAYGYRDLAAILTGDKLVDTKEEPTPIHANQRFHAKRTFDDFQSGRRRRFYPQMMLPDLLDPSDPSYISFDETTSRALLVGDHLVEVTFDTTNRTALVASAVLGERVPAGVAHDELGADSESGKRLAAWGNEMVYLRTADDEAQGARSTIMRSKDLGTTWTKEDALAGYPATGTSHLDVAIGPRGWTYVTALCQQGNCAPAKVRPAGKTTLVDLVADKFAAYSFTFDEAHDKVYAVGGSGDGGVVYEGPLDGATFTVTKLPLLANPEHAVLTVDGEGTLRVFEPIGTDHLQIHRYTLKHDVLPTLHLETGGAIAFAGRRGLIVNSHGGYETSDAGDTWTRVPSNGSGRSLTCGDAGCVMHNAQRVGWDLPALSSSQEVLRPALTTSHDAPVAPPHAPSIPPLSVACTASGKPTPVDLHDTNWIDGTGTTRWARLAQDMDNDSVVLLLGAKDKVTRVPLFGASGTPGPGGRIVTGTGESDDGLIAARYRYMTRSATGTMNPVNVELAWWSSATNKVHHAFLGALPSFYVSRLAVSGTARVVDGGLLFRGSNDDKLRFAHDDGHVETLGAPDMVFSEAWHSGKRWLLLGTDKAVLELATSDDNGKTWTRRGWAFGTLPVATDGYLETASGKLMLAAPGGLYDVGWPVASDPPVPVTLDASRVAGRCDNAVGSMIHRDRIDGAPVTVDIGGTKLNASDRVFHDTAAGALCTSAYIFEDRGHEAYLYPEAAGWSGWLVANVNDKESITPLTCH